MTTTAPITEHVLTLASGHRLRYATRGADLPIAVVFVHGWPDSWRSFEPVLDALPPTTSAVSVSLRGFGGSDAPPDGYTPDDFAADVRELVDHLDVTSAVFVGHSMGTLVVQRLAASHPEIVAGLVLIGGLNQLPDDVFDDVWSVVQDLTDPISEPFVREFQSSTLAAPVPDRFFDQLVAESLQAPARVWRAAFAGIRTMPRRHGDQRSDAAAVGRPGRARATHRAGHPPRGDPRRPPRRLRGRRPQPQLGAARTRRPRHRGVPASTCGRKGAPLPFDTPPARVRHEHEA